MTGGELGTISLALNDAELATDGHWYPDLEEFQTSAGPPSDHNKWALPGLTYPLIFVQEGRQESVHRVYTIPSQIKGGLRFKVYHDPTSAASKPASPDRAALFFRDLAATPVAQQPEGRLSPAQQRLATALGTDNDKAATLKFMRDVFVLFSGQKRIQLGDITKAVQEHVESGLGRPTTHQIAEKLSRHATAPATSTVPAAEKAPAPAPATPAGSSAGETPATASAPSAASDSTETQKKQRKHVSVWEIRN